jgi:membrane fusion protein (multidrug efflux system)|tara:strand:+ start:63 stop:926 length:864 start_codon:yes stop_codon:yes gene_type:complete
MKRSKKVTIGIIIFFIIVATVIGGRTAMGIYFKKKFSKRPPPGVIVEIVSQKRFSQTIESYCTALSSKTTSFKIKKSELLEPIKFEKVKKGGIIAKLEDKTIIAPFSGNIGTRGISSSILGTDSIIVTLDESKKILCDLQIPEVFASILKKGLRVNAKFLAYKNKLYQGVIISHASRIDAQTRSILARAQIGNEDLEILPGSLLDIELLYNEKEALSVADTSIIFEDEKKFVYKVLDNNKLEKTEIKTGVRKEGNLEVLEGLLINDKVVKEGLTRLANGMVIKPIIK